MSRTLSFYLNLMEKKSRYGDWSLAVHSTSESPSSAKGVIFSVKVNIKAPDHKEAPIVFNTSLLEVPEWAVAEPLEVELFVGDER